MKHQDLFFLLLLMCGFGCSQNINIPNRHYTQYRTNSDIKNTPTGVDVYLENTLECPIRFWVMSDDSIVYKKLESYNPISLEASEDTLLHIEAVGIGDQDIRIASRLGHIGTVSDSIVFNFPFPRDKRYKVVQGADTMPTHNSDWSRYAIDFNLDINDTICAAADGVVVGVIEDYELGGWSREWKPFSNFITIYHPQWNVFSQYVHLVHKGAFVGVGDWVLTGESIGLSGMTGQTNIAHLHFNCLRAWNNTDGLVSMPYWFSSGASCTELKQGQSVSH